MDHLAVLLGAVEHAHLSGGGIILPPTPPLTGHTVNLHST